MVGPRATAVLDKRSGREKSIRPTAVQQAWLRRGLDQLGGKLPLFDRDGKAYSPRTLEISRQPRTHSRFGDAGSQYDLAPTDIEYLPLPSDRAQILGEVIIGITCEVAA